jgi:hypothetical protein
VVHGIALVVLVIAAAACTGRGLSVGGVRIEPGIETVYVVAEGDPTWACRRTAPEDQTTRPTARVARCSIVGSSFICADDEVPCRLPDPGR